MHAAATFSADGTRIAFWSSGEGPSLLLVHGATADHTTTWRSVRALLEPHATVHAMDRRGRGGSGDAIGYELQREAEDVAAVMAAIGGPVDVLGHSYGGLCALEAALIAPNLRRLILYEAVPLDGASLYPPGIVERLAALQADDDLDGMLLTLYRDVAGMPAEDIALMEGQTEAWATRRRNAPTVPRELRSEQRYQFRPERFAAMSAPTLLLVGGDSPARERQNATGVAAALGAARVAVLPGQQHVAMHTAPGLFAAEVLAFLSAP